MVRRVRNSDFSIFDQLMSYCMIKSRDGFIRGKKKNTHQMKFCVCVGGGSKIDFINKKNTDIK